MDVHEYDTIIRVIQLLDQDVRTHDFRKTNLLVEKVALDSAIKQLEDITR